MEFIYENESYINYKMSSTQPVPAISAYSFAMKPEDYKPSGFVNLNRRLPYNVVQTVLDVENHTQTSTIVGTIDLTMNEYLHAQITDPRTGKEYTCDSDSVSP